VSEKQTSCGHQGARALFAVHSDVQQQQQQQAEYPYPISLKSEPHFAIRGLKGRGRGAGGGDGDGDGDGERARDLRVGPVGLERPELDPELGVEIHVDVEAPRGLLLPELGGGDVALEQLRAAEPRRQLGGRPRALVEGVERRVAEALALVRGQRLDVVVVEPHPRVGVAHRHGDVEAVGERGGSGERELGERGRVDGGRDHARLQYEVEGEGQEAQRDGERDEDAAQAAEEAPAGAAQARDGAARGAHGGGGRGFGKSGTAVEGFGSDLVGRAVVAGLYLYARERDLDRKGCVNANCSACGLEIGEVEGTAKWLPAVVEIRGGAASTWVAWVGRLGVPSQASHNPTPSRPTFTETNCICCRVCITTSPTSFSIGGSIDKDASRLTIALSHFIPSIYPWARNHTPRSKS
jgi:hypothetical protein